MELNNPCRICIEQQFEATMQFWTTTISGVFGVMFQELGRFRRNGNVTDPLQLARLDSLITQIGGIASTMSREKVEEFYSYYVTRALYAQLGVTSYITNYAAFMGVAEPACAIVNGAPCPLTVNASVAMQHLRDHADGTFSSITTAGSPFPFWNEGNGTGYMFAGNLPVGGSGINMGGQIFSTTVYMDLANVTNPANWRPRYSAGFMDPTDIAWAQMVETDPVYRWFIASVTPMTSHCGNGNLTGTNTGIAAVDGPSRVGAEQSLTQKWCTKYNVPFETDDIRTQQHFAKMWYDLLLDSPSFLGVVQGTSDPYIWTTGQGCGYTLRGQRYSYFNQSEQDILSNSSRLLYYIDEGVSVGAIDRNLLIGGVTPAIGQYNYENPIQHASVLQNIYILARFDTIVKRVKNCNRPGGPIEISDDEAKDVLFKFKEAFEENWVKGWDDPNDGQVQFVGFSDDQGGAVGTTGRLLEEITLDNGTLMAISIAIIVVFSVAFLFSFDPVESRVLLTLFGVALVLISFFAALGVGILIGIKINVNIAWTLPFIILGLGVDDMYIVMLALKKQRDYSTDSFMAGMREVVIPVTMTSLVNAAMFAVMNLVDVPAVSKTAQMALIAVIFLYLIIILSFPAYCYLDMKRQQARRYDVLVCLKKKDGEEQDEETEVDENGFLYNYLYKPLVLGPNPVRLLVHAFILLGGLAMFGVGIYGITERNVGLGLEDFFPEFHQAKTWAIVRTEELASWSIGMNWGRLDYTAPEAQLGMVGQFENVIKSPFIAEVDTKQLWMADFMVWTTRQCSANFDRADPTVLECGMDQVYLGDNSTCSGEWVFNSMNLREKKFSNGLTCNENEGGICRPTLEMHPDDLVALGIDPINPTNVSASWCPVFNGWSQDKFAFCLRRWSNFTGGGGDLVTVPNTATENPSCTGEFLPDAEIKTPLVFSRGPTMFAIDLKSHDDTLEMIRGTRSVCDDHPRLHCWLTGIPFDYWEQYLWVEDLLLQISAASVGVGFVVAFIFLACKLMYEGHHGTGQIIVGSLIGAALISLMTLLSLISVIGISVLAGVNLTAFSDMSFVLSVGFSVEYAVHVLHRFLEAPLSIDSAVDRVDYAMSFLTLPTFMSFVSSTVGVACLAFTDFEFNEVFFFRPLIIVMPTTYFFGCWFLPVLLTMMGFDALKLGAPDHGYYDGQPGKQPVGDDFEAEKSMEDEVEKPMKEDRRAA